ncbi:MAG: capsule assembly Wzi family protein [Rhodothermales bacterium]
MRTVALFFALLLAAPAVHAQQEGLLQPDDEFSRVLQRQRVLGRLPGAHLGARPLSAYTARAYADSALAVGGPLGSADRALLRRLTGRTAGPGVATVRRLTPFLYGDGNSFYSVRADDYALEVEPLANLSYGRARQSAREDREATVPLWQNTRGVRAAGHVGDHIFFEARLEENQRRPVATAYDQRVLTAPRLGNSKIQDGTTYDYFVATGVVGFRSKYFEARFGRDRNEWGYGRTSLHLSDYATVYDQLQIRTQFWRLHYTNLFAQFAAFRPADEPQDSIVPRKYGVFHRLAIDLPARVQVELFESVIFASDSTGAGRRPGFDLAYLNPIIFYRAVEHDLGSPDNALLGAGVSWVATPGVELYAQGILDELTVSEFGNDWWGNKWGYLVGLYLVDPGIGETRLRDFDLRVEYARQRPFLYGHRTEATAYVHYGDYLGHPAGPNSSDLAVFATYRPWARLLAAVNLAFTTRGRDPEGEIFGADPTRPYSERDRSLDRSAETLRGIRQNLVLAEARIGYELLPSLFVEGTLRAESVDDAERGLDRYVAPSAALRWGLPFQSTRY